MTYKTLCIVLLALLTAMSAALAGLIAWAVAARENRAGFYALLVILWSVGAGVICALLTELSETKGEK